MSEQSSHCDVVADFWEWYEGRHAREHSPLAGYALARCEETFTLREWDSFGYWHAIYVRERRKAPRRPHPLGDMKNCPP